MPGVYKKCYQRDTSIHRGTPLHHIHGGRLLCWSQFGVNMDPTVRRLHISYPLILRLFLGVFFAVILEGV
jgi:hypothetical protein